MANPKSFPLVRGRTMRVTTRRRLLRTRLRRGQHGRHRGLRLGRPDGQHQRAPRRSPSPTPTARRACVTPGVPEFHGYGVEITFCEVSPCLFSIVTGQPSVVDAAGDVVGFRMNSGVSVLRHRLRPGSVDGRARRGLLGRGRGLRLPAAALPPGRRHRRLHDRERGDHLHRHRRLDEGRQRLGHRPVQRRQRRRRRSGHGAARSRSTPTTTCTPSSPRSPPRRSPTAAPRWSSPGHRCATAGTPGTWNGTAPCDRSANLIAGTPQTSSPPHPPRAWTTGQYVQTATAGAPGQVHWNGTAWATGRQRMT